MHSSFELPLARLRPRDELFYVSRNRTVLATARDGFVHGEGQEGLYLHECPILSIYRYSIDGKSLQPVGVSNIEEHSQTAYYVTESPNANRDLFQGALGPGGQAAKPAPGL
jgi:N-terminal domain of (some) glycogen debranching enzymes